MQDVSIKSRTTAPLVLSFIDEAGNAVTISAASAIRFGVKEAMLAGIAPLFTKTLAGATLTRVGETISIPLLTGDWDLIPPGTYVMDVDITISADNFVSDSYLLIVEPRAAVT